MRLEQRTPLNGDYQAVPPVFQAVHTQVSSDSPTKMAAVTLPVPVSYV
ncbi:unnamed protein product [Staurois parvus]|uniref:Uncharacterized protein n=1 Tax=Staurois parvus TaxID=386267 RepID=A0ABN9H2H8_9NEOB|nr:unnamed protein product [Staurois parvus]